MVGRHLSLAMLKSKKYYDLLFQHALLRLPGFALQNFVKNISAFGRTDSKNSRRSLTKSKGLTSAISKCGVLVLSSSGWPDLAALSPERLNEMP